MVAVSLKNLPPFTLNSDWLLIWSFSVFQTFLGYLNMWIMSVPVCINYWCDKLMFQFCFHWPTDQPNPRRKKKKKISSTFSNFGTIWFSDISDQGLKWRRVKKEEDLNRKGGNYANLVNKKHNLQDSIKNYHQKTRKLRFRPILCLIISRTFQMASKTEKKEIRF